MKIIISHSFLSLFEKTFKYQHIKIDDFCRKLKETPLIHIKNPIFKYKFFIKSTAVRGFVARKNSDTLVPLYIVFKNTLEGHNLVLDSDMKTKLNHLL